MNQASVTDCPVIPVAVPEQAVLARLGGNRHRTALSAPELVRFRCAMQQARSVMRPRGRYTVIPLRENDGTRALAGESWHLECASLCRLLGDAPWLWVGAVTIGGELTELVARAGDKLAEAVIYDAAGSECADSAMDLLQQQAARQLVRLGKLLGPRRFSPGYGDWSLAAQREIFALLNLAEIGMRYDDNFFMHPEKSVTAVAPVFPA